jgi:hypothetical protein
LTDERPSNTIHPLQQFLKPKAIDQAGAKAWPKCNGLPSPESPELRFAFLECGYNSSTAMIRDHTTESGSHPPDFLTLKGTYDDQQW